MKIQHTQSGFTILELMIALAILGVLLTIGVPALTNYLKDSRITNQTNALVASLNYARGEAINLNSDVHITMLNSDWSGGWEIWSDGFEACSPVSRNNSQEDCEVIRQFSLNGDVKIESTGSLGAINTSPAAVGSGLASKSVSFSGDNGRLSATSNIDFYVCDSATSNARPGHHISIDAVTGRVAVETDAKGNPVNIPGEDCSI